VLNLLHALLLAERAPKPGMRRNGQGPPVRRCARQGTISDFGRSDSVFASFLGQSGGFGSSLEAFGPGFAASGTVLAV